MHSTSKSTRTIIFHTCVNVRRGISLALHTWTSIRLRTLVRILSLIDWLRKSLLRCWEVQYDMIKQEKINKIKKDKKILRDWLIFWIVNDLSKSLGFTSDFIYTRKLWRSYSWTHHVGLRGNSLFVWLFSEFWTPILSYALSGLALALYRAIGFFCFSTDAKLTLWCIRKPQLSVNSFLTGFSVWSKSSFILCYNEIYLNSAQKYFLTALLQ